MQTLDIKYFSDMKILLMSYIHLQNSCVLKLLVDKFNLIKMQLHWRLIIMSRIRKYMKIVVVFMK